MQAFSGNLSDVDTWYSTSEVNGQRPIDASGINIAQIYKKVDRICELNYRGTKCEIEAKIEDQKCNFAKKKE